ncbi:MAG TPA: sugar phosphate nucleotidyltransferase [Myxococcota bacterium]|nr:sugar phosphate nucleotidyltransferase [Myxococcota bacterium]HRY95304.1 sugar phosphate nucleotidyltransferase [Myxococcota bacterium]HSA21629.1 sugar phosphate nucleotidyltransferase [Myxococcota bacterium]
MNLYCVILAGGSGTRFWPLSRGRRPKQLLAIGGPRSLLRETAERLLPMCGWARTLVVASAPLAAAIRAELPEMPAENLLLEPVPRNTAPAIGLAALEVMRRDPAGVLAVLPSDHLVRPAARFRRLIRAAALEARAGQALVTLGVTPARPETGYGYIRRGRPAGRRLGLPVFEVRGFFEKPARRRAEAFVRAGDYLWNSGMFVFTAQAALKALADAMPALRTGLLEVAAAPARARAGVLRRVFERTEALSFDQGVMERLGGGRVLPFEAEWSDVGSWNALREVLPLDRHGNAVEGDALALDCRGCVVRSTGRLVAAVGLTELAVVETEDAVLVCPLDQAQAVRKVVEALRARGRRELL